MKFDKRVIEINVVGNKNSAFQMVVNGLGNLGEIGRFCHHIIGNSGKGCHKAGNGVTRVDKWWVSAFYFFAIVQHDGDFSDSVAVSVAPRRLNIYYRIHKLFPFYRLKANKIMAKTNDVSLENICFYRCLMIWISSPESDNVEASAIALQ